MNTVRLETNRGVDGDIFTGAVPSVEDHGLFLPEVFEVLRLVAERVSGETVSKADQAEGEVVPGEPRDNLLQLHAGSARDVDDEVAQLLPVSHNIHRAGPHLRVLPAHRDTGCEAPV